MTDYIRRTEELRLAMNAGARAIANTKRYHDASYTKDVFSADSQTIPYLQAALVLREASDAPAADVAEVVYCKDCRYLGRELDKGLYSCDDYNLPYCEPDSYCSHGRRKEETKHAAD